VELNPQVNYKKAHRLLFLGSILIAIVLTLPHGFLSAEEDAVPAKIDTSIPQSECSSLLGKAFRQLGLEAERDREWNNALLYYAQALSLENEPAKMDLYRLRHQPLTLKKETNVEIKPYSNLSLFLSPDKKTFALLKRNFTLEVWSVKKKKRLHKLQMASWYDPTVWFSSDGQKLAYLNSRQISMFSVDSGKLIKKLDMEENSRPLMLLPDFKHAVIWRDSELRLETLPDSSVPFKSEKLADFTYGVGWAYSRNRRFFTIAKTDSILVFDLEGPELLYSVPFQAEKPLKPAVSPDGRYIAVANYKAPGRVRIYDGVNENWIQDLNLRLGPAKSFEFVTGGYLAVVSNAGLEVHDFMANGSEVIPAESYFIPSSVILTMRRPSPTISFGVEGANFLLQGGNGWDQVELWSLQSHEGLFWRHVLRCSECDPVPIVQFSSDYRYALVPTKHGLELLDLKDGHKIIPVDIESRERWKFAFTSENMGIQKFESKVVVWNLEKREAVKTLDSLEGSITGFYKDSLLIMTCLSEDNYPCSHWKISLQNMETGKTKSAEFKDQIFIRSGFTENDAKVLSFGDGRLRAEKAFPKSTLFEVEVDLKNWKFETFTADWQWLVFSRRNKVRVINTETGSVNELKFPYDDLYHRTYYISPDQRLLVFPVYLSSGDDSDYGLRIHHLETGELRGILPAEGDMFSDLDFSADSKMLVAAGGKKMSLWDLENKDKLMTFQTTVYESCSYSPYRYEPYFFTQARFIPGDVILTVSMCGTIAKWHLDINFLNATLEELFEQAKRDTGLSIEGARAVEN